MAAFIELPPELLIQIFCCLSSFVDETNLAICSRELWNLRQVHAAHIFLSLAPCSLPCYADAVELLSAQNRCHRGEDDGSSSSKFQKQPASPKQSSSLSFSTPSLAASTPSALYSALLHNARCVSDAAVFYEIDMDRKLPWWYTEAMRFLDLSPSYDAFTAKHGTRLKPSELLRFQTLFYGALTLAALPGRADDEGSPRRAVCEQSTLRRLCGLLKMLKWVVTTFSEESGENEVRFGVQGKTWIEVLACVKGVVREKQERLNVHDSTGQGALAWKEPVGDHCHYLWESWPNEV